MAIDKVLVEGAGKVARSRMSKGIKPVSLGNSIQARRQEAQAKKDAINNKVAGYIDNLSSDVDITNLSVPQQSAITNYLMEERNKYAQAASEIATIEDPSDPRYMELMTQMNATKSAISNLANQVNQFKSDKADYLKDFDNGLISSGNNADDLGFISGIYTDEGQMGIGPGGALSFYNESSDEFTPYSNVKKPFLKDSGTFDSILTSASNLYTTGVPLTGAREMLVRRQLSSALTQAGRDGLISLATDDFLSEGGLGLDESLFEPGRERELKEEVLNNYMNILSDTALQGQKDKDAIARRKTNQRGPQQTSETSTHYSPEFSGNYDDNGNKLYVRMPKDPNGKPIVINMGDITGQTSPAEEETTTTTTTTESSTTQDPSDFKFNKADSFTSNVNEFLNATKDSYTDSSQTTEKNSGTASAPEIDEDLMNALKAVNPKATPQELVKMYEDAIKK